jgi:seryl-tRNA synthetase
MFPMITFDTQRVTQQSATPMALPTVEEINAKAAESREKPMPVESSQRAHVDLSEAGRGAAGKTEEEPNIVGGELGEKIKDLTKRIAKLREQLQELMAQLQAAMSDRKLSEEQRQTKAQGIQAQIGGVMGEMGSLNAQLLSLVAKSKEQAAQA